MFINYVQNVYDFLYFFMFSSPLLIYFCTAVLTFILLANIYCVSEKYISIRSLDEAETVVLFFIAGFWIITIPMIIVCVVGAVIIYCVGSSLLFLIRKLFNVGTNSGIKQEVVWLFKRLKRKLRRLFSNSKHLGVTERVLTEGQPWNNTYGTVITAKNRYRRKRSAKS